ncbi:MAG: sensor histidine kinase [Caulobacterales bacterium]
MAADAGLAAYASRQAALQQTIGAQHLREMAPARDAVTRLRTGARTLATNASLFAQEKKSCDQTLSAFAKDEPNVAVAAVLGADLTVRCSNKPEAAGRKANARELVDASERVGDAVIGYVPRPFLSSVPVLAAAAPASIAGLNGQRFVFISMPLQSALAAARSNDVHGGYTALLNSDGAILDWHGLEPDSAEGKRLQAALKKTPPTQRQSAFQVGETWAVTTLLDNGQMYIVAGWTPPAPTWLALLQAAWALFAPIAVWAAAVTGVWIALEAFIVRPLQVIENLARAYARNENTHQYEELLVSAPNEISNLRRSLVALARTLRGREARLTEALEEQKTLLLEVHHRVKNNLQLITSLLSIHARASDPVEARVLLRANESIQLLNLAHNFIYNSGEVRGVALDRLAEEVARTLVSGRQNRGINVGMETELQPVRAATDLAVPFAFLLGETLSTLLDDIDAEASERSVINMRMYTHKSGVRLELNPLGATKAARFNSTTRRIVTAFAAQIGASLDFGNDVAPTIVMEISANKLLSRAPEDVTEPSTAL